MPHPHLTTEQRGGVLVVTVDDGKANAFSTSLLTELAGLLAQAETDRAIGSMVIAGNGSAFFAGFDLGVIRGGDRAAIAELVSAGGAFVRMCYGAGIPVVGAANGHAVAAGALLLLGCDHRIGVEGPVKIGLNEVAIGLSLPGWAITISQDRLSRRFLQRCVVDAELLDGATAVGAGFLDEAVAADRVVDRAVEVAADLADRLDPAAYRATARSWRGHVLATMDAGIAADREAAGL
jgi:enoyl-CoA hydratase